MVPPIHREVTLVDTSGEVIELYGYEAYGRAVYLDDAFALQPDGQSDHGWQHLHQGGRLDTITSNYHFRHRDLSHSLGRWISQDPIGFEAGDANLYRYVGNGPISRVDPQGLEGFLSNYLHYLLNPKEMDWDLVNLHETLVQIPIDYWHYLTNPTEMDEGLAFTSGLAWGAAGAALGGLGGMVIGGTLLGGGLIGGIGGSVSGGAIGTTVGNAGGPLGGTIGGLGGGVLGGMLGTIGPGPNPNPAEVQPDPNDPFDGYYGQHGSPPVEPQIVQDSANFSAVENGPINIHEKFDIPRM